MSEFFLELFTEEIPSKMQSIARNDIIQNFKNFFEKENINYKGISESYSTPNRLIIYFQSVNPEILQKSEVIRGPTINASDQALDGFMKSNKITNNDIFKKKNR